MNYNIVVDTSNFKPFSYLEKVAPLLLYRDAYEKQLEKLENFMENYGLLALPTSSKYYLGYLQFNDELFKLAGSFSRGMTKENRAALSLLFVKGKLVMGPLKKAVEAYNKYIDKLDALGPDAILARELTVDDFYGGLNPGIKYQSAKLIQQDSALYFAGLNNALTEDPEFKEILGGLYFQMIEKGGLSSADALSAALLSYRDRHPEAGREVNDIVAHLNNVFDKYNTKGYSEEAKELIWNRIVEGMMSSVTGPKYSNVANGEYISAEARERFALERAQQALSYKMHKESMSNQAAMAAAARDFETYLWRDIPTADGLGTIKAWVTGDKNPYNAYIPLVPEVGADGRTTYTPNRTYLPFNLDYLIPRGSSSSSLPLNVFTLP